MIALAIFITITSVSFAKNDEEKLVNSVKDKEVSQDKEDKGKKEEKKEDKKEDHKGPDITVSQGDKPITGVEKVEVKADKNSVVDLQLQTTQGNIGTVYLGRVKVEENKDKAKTEFKWDSKNTPNGEYKLFGTVSDQKGAPVIVGPVDVKVDNSAPAIAKKKEEIKVEKAAQALTSGTKTPEPAASVRPSPRASVLPSPGDSKAAKPNIPTASPTKTATPAQKEVAKKSEEPAASATSVPRGVAPEVSPEPTPNPVAEFEVVNSVAEDIVFPSEFNPTAIATEPNTKVEKVENTKLENNNVALTFKGTSLPNTVITILIFSNPIVVTVKTDANGAWTYHLEKPLTPGKHAVYTVATTPDGTQVRSEVADFFIAPALAASSDNESLILASATEDKALKNFALATSLIIGSGLLFLVLLFKYKRKALLTSTQDDVT